MEVDLQNKIEKMVSVNAIQRTQIACVSKVVLAPKEDRTS